MLRKSNKSIPSVKRIFAKQNLKVAFLVPTPTGLTKGYMDAIKSFREYLKKEKIHDFSKQNVGQSNKLIFNTQIHSNGKIFSSKFSLSKTQSKGHPRIGVYSLKKYAKPYDLIAFTNIGGSLEIINCSSVLNLSSYINSKFVYQTSVKNNFNQFQSSKNPKKPKGRKKPKKNKSSATNYTRDPAVEAWVLYESNGICECCKNPSPFIRASNGDFYLEIHHVKRLADGGSDTISNAVAVCANCHREFHYGINKKQLENRIYKRIKRLIKE